MTWYMFVPYLSALTSVFLLGGTLILTPSTSYFRVFMLAVIMIPITITTFTAKFVSSMDIFNICFGIAFGPHFLFDTFDLLCISRVDYQDVHSKANKKTDDYDDNDEYSSGSCVARPKPAIPWVADLILNKRRIRQPGQVKNLPVFDSRNPHKIVSRRELVMFRATRFALFYLLLDFLSTQLMENAEVKFAIGKENLLYRIVCGELSSSDAAESIGGIIGFGVSGVMFIIGCHDLGSVLVVGSGLGNVADWPPLFGPITEAYSVRRFWGVFWHQEIRKVVQDNSSFLAHNILRLPRGNKKHQGSSSSASSRSTIPTLIARYAKIQFAFVISGLIHTLVDVMQDIPLEESGVVAFFSSQALGFLIEDLACAVYRWVTTGSPSRRGNGNAKRDNSKAVAGEEAGDRKPDQRLWIKAVGFLWVLLWMVHSASVWVFPFLRRAPVSVVPFTFFSKTSV